MKKITQKQVEELARQALDAGNPYIEKSVRYNIGNKPMYLYAESMKMTREEIDEAYYETACQDVRRGYNDRSVGYYDKWYRYSRADSGRAYDLGVKLASNTCGCVQEMHIIPCSLI